jgi:exopolysaccharide biosynthesis WecB/TagA/CpsF family protein
MDSYLTLSAARGIHTIKNIVPQQTRRCKDLCEIPLTEGSLNSVVETIEPLIAVRPSHAFLVTFASPFSVALLDNVPSYRRDLARMDMVLSDGIAMTIAARAIGRFAIDRISFDSTSLAPVVFDITKKHRSSMVLVGGRAGVADAAASRIRENFPGISILGVFQGYASLAETIAAIRDIDPPVVICGMGIPRQEALLMALADAGWTGCGFTCGGYLDHLTERFHYYPPLINRLNLRWLYRLMREPNRLGHRYFVEYRPFASVILRQYLGLRPKLRS